MQTEYKSEEPDAMAVRGRITTLVGTLPLAGASLLCAHHKTSTTNNHRNM